MSVRVGGALGRVPGGRSLGGVLVLSACAVTGAAAPGAWAGEASEAAAGEGAKPSLWEWDSADRRDPFVFKLPEAEKPATAGSRIVKILAGPDVDKGDKTPPPKESDDLATRRLRTEKIAEVLAVAAFEALGRQQYAKAEEFVTDAGNRMRTVGLEKPDLEERLARLKSTAERLRAREETETEFRNLKIVIRGIVWQPTRPVALINDAVVQQGDIVLGARVEEIRPDEVIFSLKGVKVSRSP